MPGGEISTLVESPFRDVDGDIDGCAINHLNPRFPQGRSNRGLFIVADLLLSNVSFIRANGIKIVQD